MQKRSLAHPMQSDLERTNSWRFFLKGLERSLQEKEYSLATIRSIFRFVDPEFDRESIGLRRYFLYLLFWNTSFRGRIARYELAFRSFMERKRSLFKDAPKVVIETLNRFFDVFLGPLSSELSIPLEWARRSKTKRELLIEKGERSEKAFLEAGKKLAKEFLLQQEKSTEQEVQEFVFRKHEPQVVIGKEEVPALLFSRGPQDNFEKKRELLRRLSLLPKECQGKESLFRTIQILEVTSALDFTLYEEKVSTLWKEYIQASIDRTDLLYSYCFKAAFYLWPTLSSELVWSDMSQELVSTRASVLGKMKNFFLSTSREQMEKILSEILHDDDSRAFFGECIHRSFRQKDLVTSIHEKLYEAIQLCTFAKTIEHPGASEIEVLIDQLLEKLLVVLTPKGIDSKEEVAAFFRKRWIEVESAISRIDYLHTLLKEAASKESLDTYIRATAQLLLYLPNGRSLYTSLMEIRSLDELFVWQKERLYSLRCGLLLVFSPEDARSMIPSILSYTERKAKDDQFKKVMLEAIVGDAPFVEIMSWYQEILFDYSFVYSIQKSTQNSFLWEKLFSDIEVVLQTWWAALPLSLHNPFPDLIERVEKDPLCSSESVARLLLKLVQDHPQNIHGAFLKLLLEAHNLLLELRSQNDFQSYLFTVRLVAILQEMLAEFLLEGCLLKEKTVRAFYELLLEKKEYLIRFERLFTECQRKEDLSMPSFTLPVIGSVQWFLH